MKPGAAPNPPVQSRWIGRLDGVAEAFRAPQRFVLAGIDWHRPAGARIELRARQTDGSWTPWLTASVLGHDSDRGETVAPALVGEPVWTGPADALQLRSDGVVEGLSVHLVLASAVAGLSAADRHPADPSAADRHPADRHPADPSAADRHPGERHPAADSASATPGLPLATPRLPAGPGQPPIIARSAWARHLRPRAAPAYGDVRVAFVHHSVNGNGYSSAAVPEMLRSIYVFHTYVRGWNDFGYNFAIDAYGRIWEGRAGGIDRPVIGAQAGGYNAESFGVVLLGDFSAALPSSAALDSLSHLIAWKLALHGVPVSGRVLVEVDPPDAHYTRFRPGQHVSLPRIAAHRDGCTTDCPGYDMYVNGMPPLRRAVAELTGRQYRLTLSAGPASGSPYSLAPYRIAPGTRARPATYLDLQTVTIAAGRELPVHGFLRSFGGEPRRGARIALQDVSSTRDEDRVSDLAFAVTHADGLWVAVLKPHANLLLRALHADAPAACSPLTLVGVRPELTLTVQRVGSGVRAMGTVYPFKHHIELDVIAASGLRRVVRRATVDSRDGLFEATLRLPRGRYWIRASARADAVTVAGGSPEVAVQV